LSIRKFVTSVVVGSAVLVGGLGLAAAPAHASTVKSESVATESTATSKKLSVSPVKSLQIKRATSGTTATISWKKPTYTGVLSGYLVNVYQKNKVVKEYYITDPSKLEQKVSGLKKGVSYTVGVTAITKSSDKRSVATMTAFRTF
jgi:hypothetical protein